MALVGRVGSRGFAFVLSVPVLNHVYHAQGILLWRNCDAFRRKTRKVQSKHKGEQPARAHDDVLRRWEAHLYVLYVSGRLGV